MFVYLTHSTTRGLEDVSRYPRLLTSLMTNHSWTEDQIKKLAGNNLLRVFSKVEKVCESPGPRPKAKRD